MPNNSNRNFLIKLVFGLALLIFIGSKVAGAYLNEEYADLILADNGMFYMLFAFCLIPLNWFFETYKWHLLSKLIQEQTFMVSLKQVLAGVSTSLMTPNRIGNFIGRAILAPKGDKSAVIVATIHSNLAQFTASILFGFLGLLLIGFQETIISETTIQISALIVLAVGFLFYFFPNILLLNPIQRLFSDDVKLSIKSVQNQSVWFKLIIVMISLMRYLVFLSQFALILYALNVTLDIQQMIPAIAVVFLITTVIPSFLFGKLFVREASALFILTAFGVSSFTILASVFLLWLANLAVPALIGATILFKEK